MQPENLYLLNTRIVFYGNVLLSLVALKKFCRSYLPRQRFWTFPFVSSASPHNLAATAYLYHSEHFEDNLNLQASNTQTQKIIYLASTSNVLRLIVNVLKVTNNFRTGEKFGTRVTIFVVLTRKGNYRGKNFKKKNLGILIEGWSSAKKWRVQGL